MRFLLLSLLACLALGAPQCGGILSGIRQEGSDPKNCSFIDIAQPSGQITRTAPFVGCADVGTNSNGSPLTTFSYDEHVMFFMTGSGQYVYWLDQSTTDSQIWATLPAKYDFPLSLQPISNQGLYILTTSTLYLIPLSEDNNNNRTLTVVTSLASLNLTSSALVTGDFWDPYIYIWQDNVITTLDLSTAPATVSIKSVKADMSGITDLEVYSPDGYTFQLLAMNNWTIYLTDYSLGTSKAYMTIPQGTGSPAINSMGPDTFFFCDSKTLYTISIPDKQTSKGSFDGTNLEGFFQYHP